MILGLLDNEGMASHLLVRNTRVGKIFIWKNRLIKENMFIHIKLISPHVIADIHSLFGTISQKKHSIDLTSNLFLV